MHRRCSLSDVLEAKLKHLTLQAAFTVLRTSASKSTR